MTDICKDFARELARVYHTLSSEDLEALAEILVPMKFNKGEQVLREGEVCQYMYFVVRGLVRQYYFENDKDLTEHISYEGKMVICLESFLQQKPTYLMVETLENSLLCGIPYKELHELAAQRPQVEVLYRKVLERSLLDSQEKADIMRFETASDRYKRLVNTQPEILRRTPLVFIASFLQMTPETLSRVRAKYLSEKK